MLLTEWITQAVAARLDQPGRDRLLAALRDLDEAIFDGQDLNRMAGAMVILFEENPDGLASIVAMAKRDWRDLLMAAGLAHADWQNVLEERLGDY